MNEKLKKIPAGLETRTNVAMEGVLAMQVHKGPAMTIEFKDMRIKHLPDDLPIRSAEEHPIPLGSKGVRPQGKLPKGWKAPEFSR